MAEIILVAAVAENGVIGARGALPWSLPTDLARFRAMTLHRSVIMGRGTFVSIGRPLSQRTNIVVSRQWHAAPETAANGVVVCADPWAAIDLAGRCGASPMIIGGGRLFAAMIDRADRLEITRVHARPKGDVYFPEIDRRDWRLTHMCVPGRSVSDSAAFSFRTYRRRARKNA